MNFKIGISCFKFHYIYAPIIKFLGFLKYANNKVHLECHIFKKSNALVEMFSTIFFHFYKYYLLLHSHFRNKRFMLKTKRKNLAKYFKIRHLLGIWKPHFMWLMFSFTQKCQVGKIDVFSYFKTLQIMKHFH